MAFSLKYEFIALLKKHSSFFDQMSKNDFCILCDFTNYDQPFLEKANDIFQILPQDSKIAICGAGMFTQLLLDALSEANRSKIAYYTCTDGSHDGKTFHGQRVLSPVELKSKNVDYILLSSFEYQSDMRKNLLNMGFNEKMIIDTRTITRSRHNHSINSSVCTLCNPAVMPISCKNLSAIYNYFEGSHYFFDERKQIEALYTLLLGFIIARDVVNVRKYGRAYLDKHYPFHDLLEVFLDELDALMVQTSSSIQARKEDILVIYLFDAYEYIYLEFMPNLENIYKQSLVFKKAFTQYKYTSATLQIMFTGRDLIDERAYEVTGFTEENSPLLRTIKDSGYKFHVFRGDHRLKTLADCSFVSKHYTNDMASSQYFEMLDVLSIQDEKQILFVHMFETHSPFPSPFNDQVDDANFTQNNPKPSRATFGILCKTFAYADEQFAFFDRFLPEKTTRVVMSDHGSRLLLPESLLTKEDYKYVNDQYRNTRIALFVSGPQILPGVNNDFFSIKDFERFLRFLWGKTDIGALKAPYIKLQILPVYDQWVFNFLTTVNITPSLPQKGIINEQGVYLYFYNGMESFFPNEQGNQIDNPDHRDEIEKMRALCGTDFYDLFNQPKFALAKEEYLKRGLIKEDE